MLLRFKNWSRYQSFNRRRPEWIKLHHAILSDGKFQNLPLDSRALLPMLWLVASEFADGEIRCNHVDIAVRVRWSTEAYLRALPPLFDALFVIPDAESAQDFLIQQSQLFEVKGKSPTKRGKRAEVHKTPSNKDSENQSLREEESNNRDSESQSRADKENVDADAAGLFDQEDASLGDATARAIELWNDMAGQVGLSKAQRVTGPRRAKVIARLRDVGGLEGWKRLLARVASSDWLCGRTDRSDWQCGLDFILTPAKFTKLIEGDYDNKKPNGSHGATSPQSKQARAIAGIRASIAKGRAREQREADVVAPGDHAEPQGAGGMDDDYGGDA